LTVALVKSSICTTNLWLINKRFSTKNFKNPQQGYTSKAFDVTQDLFTWKVSRKKGIFSSDTRHLASSIIAYLYA
jgi:hypothetical protein